MNRWDRPWEALVWWPVRVLVVCAIVSTVALVAGVVFLGVYGLVLLGVAAAGTVVALACGVAQGLAAAMALRSSTRHPRRAALLTALACPAIVYLAAAVLGAEYRLAGVVVIPLGVVVLALAWGDAARVAARADSGHDERQPAPEPTPA